MENVIKMLFIGNSHTYYNDMAYILKYFSAQEPKGPMIEPVTIVHPGRTLGEHKVEPEVRFNILYGEYDYVVLQQAAHPFPGEKALIEDSKDIYEYIKNTKSIPLAYMTWAEKAHPEHQRAMTDAYLKLADEIKALVVPAGIAFENLRKETPHMELYDRDGEHASLAGSYLIACIFYCVVLKKSPFGLPNRVIHNDKCILEIDQDTALLLQDTAWKTAKEFI